MLEKPIISEMEEFAKKIPPYNWYDNAEVPQNFRDFQQNILTSSVDFWYSLNNGYVNLELITDTKLEDLTKKEIDRVHQIVTEFSIEF